MPKRKRKTTWKQPTNHWDIKQRLNYPSGKGSRAQRRNLAWFKEFKSFGNNYISPQGTSGRDFLNYREDADSLRQMAEAYLAHNNNGARYWPDDDASEYSNSLKHSNDRDKVFILENVKDLFFKLNKNEYYKSKGKWGIQRKRRIARETLQKHVGSSSDPIPLDDIDMSYYPNLSPPAEEHTTYYTFAPKMEDPDAPNIPLSAAGAEKETEIGEQSARRNDSSSHQGSSVPGGQDCRESLSNDRHDNETSTTTDQSSKTSRFGDRWSLRKSMQRRQDPDFVRGDEELDQYMRTETSYSSTRTSEEPVLEPTQSQTVRQDPYDFTEEPPRPLPPHNPNLSEIVDALIKETLPVNHEPRPTRVDPPPESLQHSPSPFQHPTTSGNSAQQPQQSAKPSVNSDDATGSSQIEGSQGDLGSNVPPNPIHPATAPELAEMHYQYQLITSRVPFIHKKDWVPDKRVLLMTLAELQEALPTQFFQDSQVLLIRICGSMGTQAEVNHGDETQFGVAKTQLRTRIKEIREFYRDKRRIELLIQIEAGNQYNIDSITGDFGEDLVF